MKASIQQKQRELRAGHKMRALWMLGICGLGIVVGGGLLVRSRGASRTANGNSTSNAAAHAVTAPAAAPAIGAAVTQVSMRNLQFDPATLELKQGDVVEWKNDDLVPHTVTSTSFNSGTVVAGRSWHHTFTNAGKFKYVCTFHPQMKGVVIVR